MKDSGVGRLAAVGDFPLVASSASGSPGKPCRCLILVCEERGIGTFSIAGLKSYTDTSRSFKNWDWYGTTS